MLKTATKSNYFLSQPHQPFFILGIVNSIVMMLIFALSYKGIFTLTTESLNFHTYSLIFLVFTNMFTGFLFTTFPQFCQSDTISQKYYTNIFYLSLFGSIIYLTGAFLNHYLLILGMIISFLSHLFTVIKLANIHKVGKTVEKSDPYWIVVAQYFGIISHTLFIWLEFNRYINFYLDYTSTAINFAFYLYLILLGFSVAQRMIPFFSHSFAPKDKRFVKIVFVMLVIKVSLVTVGFKLEEMVVDIMLGLYLTREFLRWKLDILNAPAILWVLHLALLWLPVSFFLSAISLGTELILENSFYFFNLHLLAIGFLTTLLIGFGTRVTLGHSGQAPHADKFAIGIFIFIQLVVLLRALFSLNVAFSWDMNFLFDISFTTWLLLFILWGARYGKVLIFGKKTGLTK
ncbi:MAG: NnrS family protein [Campylobacterota bacterium]|nr:NnrS family protein [Campylobacterota bacterium]